MRELLKKYVVPQWFLLFVTFLYVSGFLCEFIFFDRYGIRESGESFLKARYIHAGILFLLCPISVMIPLFLKISLKKTELKEDANNKEQENTAKKSPKEEPFRFPYYTIASFLNIGLMFYFALFTPHNFAIDKGDWVFALMILISFIGARLTNWIAVKIVSHYHPHHQFVINFLSWALQLPAGHKISDVSAEKFITSFLRWSLLILVIGFLDFIMYWGFIRQLRIIFWGHHLFPPTGAVYYIFFIAMVPYVVERSNFQSHKTNHPRSKIEIKLIGVSFGLMFLFLAIIAFALRVYPYIPVAKGGGNFIESPRVKLTFRPVSGIPGGIDTNNPVVVALSSTNAYVIIEESASSLFLANVNDAGGPRVWVDMRQLPHVLEVRRDAIDQITYTQFTDTNCYPSPRIEKETTDGSLESVAIDSQNNFSTNAAKQKAAIRPIAPPRMAPNK
jgi:hypothetical protein